MRLLLCLRLRSVYIEQRRRHWLWNEATTTNKKQLWFVTKMTATSNYRALAGSLSTTEWAEKFYGLRRNYESMSRICKEKCKRNEELEGEISGLFEKNEKYDALQASKKQYMLENTKLYRENSTMQDSVLSVIFM